LQRTFKSKIYKKNFETRFPTKKNLKHPKSVVENKNIQKNLFPKDNARFERTEQLSIPKPKRHLLAQEHIGSTYRQTELRPANEIMQKLKSAANQSQNAFV